MADTRPVETLAIVPTDLAPGDARFADFDFGPFTLHLIRSSSHRLFDEAYRKLWDEFASHGAMEQRDVIVSRLQWKPEQPFGAWSYLYRIIAVVKDDKIVAVRDCTAIRDGRDDPQRIYVHLSHVLVDKEHRGGGLAGWMRAFPVQIARQCFTSAGGEGAPLITLIAEMEYEMPGDPMSGKRLGSYEKAGFLKVDPSQIRYYQPDFREPHEIDATGGPNPLPFQLIVRRVGRERETQVTAGDVRRMVWSLYNMYSLNFRPRDMAAAVRSLDRYPPPETVVRLIPPTATA